jgi:hypothetical protein
VPKPRAASLRQPRAHQISAALAPRARAPHAAKNKSDWAKDWKRGRKPRVSSVTRPTRPKLGPPPNQAMYKSVPINIWPFLTFFRVEGWKAASSQCKADARSYREEDSASGELATHMHGKSIGELLKANDPRVSYSIDNSFREQRVGIVDLEVLAAL